MRKGFLIYEEMRKYFLIYEDAISHIRLCNWTILNFLIYEETFIFFFISVLYSFVWIYNLVIKFCTRRRSWAWSMMSSRDHPLSLTWIWLSPTSLLPIQLWWVPISVADPDPNLDPDPPEPHVFGPPGSGSISQRYGFGSFCHHAKKERKILILTILWLFWLFFFKNDVNVPSNCNKQKKC